MINKALHSKTKDRAIRTNRTLQQKTPQNRG